MACDREERQQNIDKLLGILEDQGVHTKAFDDYFNTKMSQFTDENTQKTSPVLPKYKPMVQDEHIDPLTEALTRGNKFFSDAFMTIGERGAQPTRDAFIFFHNKISENPVVGPIYSDAMDALTGAWNNSEQVQAIRQYVMPDSKYITTLNNLRSIKLATHQDQIETIRQSEDTIGKLFDAKYKTPKERHKAYKVFAESGLFGIAENGMLNELVEGNKTIDELITELEATLEKPKVDKKKAENLSKLYSNEDLSGVTVYANLEGMGYPQGTQRYKNMQALVALYSLAKVDGSAEMLQDIYENDSDLYKGLINLSLATKSMSDRLAAQVHLDGSRQYNTQKGNLIEDNGLTDWHLKAVSYEEASNNPTLLEEYGWKVLRAPTKDGSLGIYYRENTGTIRGGIATNVSYIKSGVTIPREYYSDLEGKPTEDGIVTLGYKNSMFTRTDSRGYDTPALTLTDEEREALGYNQSPVSALIRAYAHNKMLLETQVIRDHVVSSFTASFMAKEQMSDEVGKLIDDNNHPPLINIKDWSVEMYDQLPNKIKDKYRLVDKSLLSDVGNIKHNAVLVRKDLGESILGYQSKDLFGDNHKANVYHKRVKSIIRWFKINFIVLNAPKIMGDFVAGIGIASAKGASLQEIWAYSKEAYEGQARIADIRNERTKLIYLRATKQPNTPEYRSLTKKIEAVDKKLLEDPFNPAYANGFMQSLGTQLIQEDGTSSQGLQSEIETIIKKYMIDKNGKSTPLNDAIKKAANAGGPLFQLDTLYGAAGDLLKNRGTQSEKNVLKKFQEHLEGIKSKDDMSEYVAELVASPNSNLVKLGSAATLMADMMPRWIVYRHALNEGMSEQQALEEALKAIPDYKEELPSSLQFLSDLYILPFPSFFVRIQRTIANLAVNHPMSAGGQLLWEEYTGTNTTIMGSDIVRKTLKGNLISDPTDVAVFPYAQLFGF